MLHAKSKIVADGRQRYRDACGYADVRKRLLRAISQRYAEEKKGASLWRRLKIESKIYRELEAALEKDFPSGTLHVARIPK